jgi:hypothetical protein
MAEKTFIFYNVGNGQSVLLPLEDETNNSFDVLQMTLGLFLPFGCS